MPSAELITFQQAALRSGLLVEEQLDEALALVRQTVGDAAPDADEASVAELLGQKLIDLGYLNRWQVEQLKAGRTKFTLGPYQILDSIGRGGMGHVFKGRHAMLGRVEAVKVLPKSQTSPESIERFQREIRAQAQLDHPNLVRVSYAGRDRDTYFFVTEFVVGTDLRRLVRERNVLNMEEAATILSQVAQALEYAHQRSLVHRDVKPGNVLVTHDGVAKLTDLGLAGSLVEAEYVGADKASIVGTADYLAPEAIRQPGEVRPSHDIYALGCTLYYVVTGKVPFPGGTTAQKMQWHCEQAPIHPRRFNNDLSDEFLDVIADLMMKDPAERIQSASEVVRRLAPWARASSAAISGLLTDSSTTHDAGLPPPGSQVTQIEDRDAEDFSGEFLTDSVGGESPSQTSQRTDSILSAHEETLPIRERPPAEAEAPRSDRVLTFVLLALLIAAAALIVHWYS